MTGVGTRYRAVSEEKVWTAENPLTDISSGGDANIGRSLMGAKT